MSALKEKILRLIATEGPITLAQYMQLALTDPEHGYYMKRDPLGARGDFITAPEVSQIFGELIGLWFVQAWEDRRRPSRFHFVELGPGRGTLMADMLRAARVRPEFLAAAEIVLVETSPALHAIQKRTLNDANVRWLESVADIPGDMPLYLVANEFLDALPIRQFVMAQGRWHERMVTARGNELAFTLAPDFLQVNTLPKEAPHGTVIEVSLAAPATIAEVAARLQRQDGVALIIDYGHAQSGQGETFQAVKAHKFADPLAEPGEADLTAHVDFAALAKIAEAKAKVFGPITQAAFLGALGIRVRAETLKHGADAATRASIDSAVDRLTSAKQMGTLFKVMAMATPDAPSLPGFP